MPRLAGRVLLRNLKLAGSAWKENVSGSCKTQSVHIYFNFQETSAVQFSFCVFFPSVVSGGATGFRG